MLYPSPEVPYWGPALPPQAMRSFLLIIILSFFVSLSLYVIVKWSFSFFASVTVLFTIIFILLTSIAFSKARTTSDAWPDKGYNRPSSSSLMDIPTDPKKDITSSESIHSLFEMLHLPLPVAYSFLPGISFFSIMNISFAGDFCAAEIAAAMPAAPQPIMQMSVLFFFITYRLYHNFFPISTNS